jgi:DNA-binding IclR family transcriptional regulator
MKELRLFTSRGLLLIQVIKNPGVTIKELADGQFLTRRSVWGIVGELRRLGYLLVTRRGKTHHYTISSTALVELRKLTEGR